MYHTMMNNVTNRYLALFFLPHFPSKVFNFYFNLISFGIQAHFG